MSKIKVDAHPSVTIAFCAESGKLLLSVYDQGYPRAAYRGSANNIGGNPEGEDRSPEAVLVKEIKEEFDPEHSEEKQYVGKVLWAPKGDIEAIRNSLLSREVPLQDFLVKQEGIIEGGNKPYTAIYSAFLSPITPEAIEIAERNIRDGKNIPTEGLVGVFTLDQLINNERGEFSTAHATAPSLNWYFQSKIPFPSQLHVEPIGPPRPSFSSYLQDFEYLKEQLVRAARADL